ncbi:MAG: hypothetical protein U0324_23745 [Polyangiales bacterium]
MSCKQSREWAGDFFRKGPSSRAAKAATKPAQPVARPSAPPQPS